jgi:AcrR family transcriptional regulator
MARWEPDAEGRLQQAAVTLFLERGYAEVTIAQIAERAGLTRRTFFNHFADKREVLFAGALSLEASAVKYLAEASAGLGAIEAAVAALTRAGQDLSGYAQFTRLRADLIASAPELQERDLIKRAALASAVAGALRRRHVPDRAADLAAQAAVTVFTTAWVDWGDDPAADFGALMQRSLAELRRAVE